MLRAFKAEIADWILSPENKETVQKLPDWLYGPILRWAFEHSSEQLED